MNTLYKNFTRSLIATLTLSTALFSANASADITYTGTLENGDSTYIVIDSGVPVDILFDEFSFTALANQTYTFNLVSDFDSVFSLYTPVFTPGSATGFLIADDDGGSGAISETFDFDLTAGTEYTLVVAGYDDDESGDYSATILGPVASVAAVPEPQTYALFLAGLGMLGFAARNKKA